MSENDLLGWVASTLVFAAFCARKMVRLRILAIISNVAFIGYGYLDHLWPIVVLHAAMLPVNLLRLRQALDLGEGAGVRQGVGASRSNPIGGLQT